MRRLNLSKTSLAALLLSAAARAQRADGDGLLPNVPATAANYLKNHCAKLFLEPQWSADAVPSAPGTQEKW